MIVKLLTEHHLEFLSLKGSCRGSSESSLVKMSNCLKSHAAAQFLCSVETGKSQPQFKCEIRLAEPTKGRWTRGL